MDNLDIFVSLLKTDPLWDKDKQYGLLLKNDINFYLSLIKEIQKYSVCISKLLENNFEYLMETNCVVFITKNCLLSKNSFLKNLMIMIHEYYHVITNKINYENYKKVPQEIRDKISELDFKNFQIIQELEDNNVPREQIFNKLKELEEEDKKNNPEIEKYEKMIDSQEEMLFFPNINNKDFCLTIIPSPSFSEFVKTIPQDIKNNLSIYETYINPKTKASSSFSDFYTFLNELTAELQSIKAGIELFDFDYDFYCHNEENKILNFNHSIKDLLTVDYRELLFAINEYNEYFYIVDKYLEYSKAVNQEFYNCIINDENFLNFYKGLKMDFVNCKEKCFLIQNKYSIL